MVRQPTKRGMALLTACTFAGLLGGAVPTPPDAADTSSYRWVTLGTMGGPLTSVDRREPANALIRPGTTYLIDAGDGAATQLSGAGAPLASVKAIFISHHHLDHIGGLFAVLGLREQLAVKTPLTIYGPPHTREIVEKLMAALRPSIETGYGVTSENAVDPTGPVTVVELQNNAVVKVGDMTVTAVDNTHYAPEAMVETYRFKSLSYRFDMPDRSIVYTGDTGPSHAVEVLARNADLLVSEVIDLDATLAQVARVAPDMPKDQRDRLAAHLREQHLTTAQIGELAARANVKRVVLTHLGGGAPDPSAPARYEREVTKISGRPTTMARDLQSF